MLRQALRYRRPLALVLLAAAVLVSAVALTRDRPISDAEALVVAQTVDVDLSAIPRYGEAVFDNGVVAQAVRDQLGQKAHDDAIPEHVSLIASDDESVLLRVVGHHEDPRTAIDLANGAADAFVAQLNAAGEGVGTFSVQQYAQTATTPTSRAGTLLLPLAIAAGLALAGSLLLRRRPTPALI